MKSEQNELVTRIGPGTPCGAVMRQYWQPVALVDEFDPALDPRMAGRPLKAVRVLGQDLVLFRDQQDRWGLLDRDCPHRNADLSFVMGLQVARLLLVLTLGPPLARFVARHT